FLLYLYDSLLWKDFLLLMSIYKVFLGGFCSEIIEGDFKRPVAV
ncbi:MAG: hypothetical protein PWQ39_1163, partial [Thermacetogenium sp.]|nr:hypothetical protein [Thermacetogenium sp.]